QGLSVEVASVPALARRGGQVTVADTRRPGLRGYFAFGRWLFAGGGGEPHGHVQSRCRYFVQPEDHVPGAGLRFTGQVAGGGGRAGDGEAVPRPAGPTAPTGGALTAEVDHAGGGVVGQLHAH